MTDPSSHHSGAERTDTIRVTVRCFSRIRDVLDSAEVTLELSPGATAGEVARRVVLMGNGRLDGLPFRIAVNQEFATEADALSDGDEVALIPPVQGG